MVKPIQFEIRGSWGVITLSRAGSLNALSLDMVLFMRSVLNRVRDDARVVGIIIQSSVARVFCAGGDIKAAYELYRQKDYESLSVYIREEYALNKQINGFKKPVVAIIDGLTLGGGVGISRYATYRVVSENAKIGMPEIKIAFFPDVGAGYFLNQLSESVSKFLALTGYVLEGKDLMDAGYATHAVASFNIRSFIEDLSSGEDIKDVLFNYSTSLTETKLDDLKESIECFAELTLEKSLFKLKQVSSMLHRELMTHSPLALHIIWRHMELTRGKSYSEVVKIDLQLAHRMFHKSDFFEGVRTRLIDKGDRPVWQYSGIDNVKKKEIEAYFSAL